MRAFIGITDLAWFELLAETRPDEVNFWQPGGKSTFKALSEGELFLFKLHSPNNFVVGGGLFAHSTRLPTSLAWSAFEYRNGARSLGEMRQKIERYRRQVPAPHEDYEIGCVVLTQPFFLPRDSWIPVPPDWAPNIVQGRGYDLTSGHGRDLYERLQLALETSATSDPAPSLVLEQEERYGNPVPTRPRLGQGAFRLVVTDAYQRRCAVSGERVLPVLEAAHIRPFGQGGLHRLDNGLLLRSDLHTLFDRGYITVTEANTLEVSRKIREEFQNGRDYYAMAGKQLAQPQPPAHRPAPSNLIWHNENVFLG